MVAEIDRLRKANESLGGVFEVRAFGLVPGARLARRLGRAPGRAPRPGAGLDPGRQGRLGGRGLGGRRPPGLGVPRRDLLVRASAAGTARPTAPAASRAGCRTASRSSCAAALKPISTLTKPLRSVDTETKQPAQALRERTDSTVVPGRRRGRRGDDRAGAGALLPGEVRRRPHRRRSRRRGRLPGADRVAALGQSQRAAPPRSSSSASWAAGKTAAASAARDAGLEARRRRRAARARARDADRRVLRRVTARRSSAAARTRRGRQLLEGADGGVIALGGGSVLLRAGPRGARPPRGRLAARSRSTRPGERVQGKRSAAGPGPRALRRRCYAERDPIYESLADAILPPGDERRPRGRCRRSRALRDLPAGTRMAWATSESGEYPAFVGRGLLGAGFWPLEGRSLPDHRHDGRPAVRATRSSRSPVGSRSSPASRRRPWPRPSGCCASSPAPG